MRRNTSVKRGDTIIEVMLAMSVIGIVLGAAFGIANRSISAGQDAQERTEALKIAETQLEIFRSQFSESQALRDRTDINAFCFELRTGAPLIQDDESEACQNISPDGGKGLYSVKIVPPAAIDTTGSYTVEVRWQRLNATAQENSENVLILYYKLSDSGFKNRFFARNEVRGGVIA